MPKRVRLDHLVVERGLAPTGAKAQAYIMTGEIVVDGVVVTKPGHATDPQSTIEHRSNRSKYVSRGGEKLEGALLHFGIDVTGFTALDVGASTGGFTDCLLQRGADFVYATDVGTGQLDVRLRNDPRVQWRESFHARKLEPSLFEKPIDLAMIDVSFISLSKVLPFVIPCVRPGGSILALIKPQFEAEKKDVPKGVLRDESLRQSIIRSTTQWASEHLGLLGIQTVDSTLKGPKGNQETFLWGTVSSR